MKNSLAAPKKTFWNLPEDKRQKIKYVLVREFATKGYQKASLNTIAREIGIAKGSLYQYFSNKEDIFLFVFDHFTRLVKEMAGRPAKPEDSAYADFWNKVHQVLLAGISFIDTYPDYYQFYLNVLFEQDVPRREELIGRVRLFSMEYFGPMINECQKNGDLADTPPKMIVFIVDAALDRFLQGYARSYLDGGLGLSEKDSDQLNHEIDTMLTALRTGLGA